MIKDVETNVVYLSDKLQKKYSDFWGRLIKLFDEFGILWKIIPGTNDIWVRDFMPIQLSEKEFLLYQYEPDYLQDRSYRKLKTDPSSVCSLLGIKCRPTKMIIDGGNITLCGDYVVMTDKVFTENGKKKDDRDFITQLENFFQKKVIIIPWHCIDPDDEYADVYGHSDGFIHWCGGNKVLMSNHREVDPEEAKEIKQIMERNGFDVREMLFDVKEQKLKLELGIYKLSASREENCNACFRNTRG